MILEFTIPNINFVNKFYLQTLQADKHIKHLYQYQQYVRYECFACLCFYPYIAKIKLIQSTYYRIIAYFKTAMSSSFLYPEIVHVLFIYL